MTIIQWVGAKMREKRVTQQNIFHILASTEIGRELEAISKLLNENRQILDYVYDDLVALKDPETGRLGMTAEQVLRCTILKQYRNLTYEELAFHLVDSRSFRAFAKLEWGQKPAASTLQENIKSVSEATWETINRVIIGYAAKQDLEKGRTIRMDSTAVESDIHYPTDSTLLQDGIRIITRLLIEGKRLYPTPGYTFSDHRRVVKKREIRILNSKKEEERKQCYRDLIEIALRVKGYGVEAIGVLESFRSPLSDAVLDARVLAEKLERVIGILSRVIDQTRRRVIEGETVPASEKVVSFFECHADIIEKGNREITYGHKLFLVGGASGLIIDCVMDRGNPADSAKYLDLLDRQEEIYGRFPRQASADGGFASKDNLRKAKERGVRDVSFSKRKGLAVLEMVNSSWVYKKLRNFRAGIEANISVLKRAFGLTRSTWSGWAGFKQYVRSAIFAYNWLTLGRLCVTTA
jgi:transposase, IS5 family